MHHLCVVCFASSLQEHPFPACCEAALLLRVQGFPAFCCNHASTSKQDLEIGKKNPKRIKAQNSFSWHPWGLGDPNY